MKREEIVPITWAPKYGVTADGRVFSRHRGDWRELSPSRSKRYLHVTLRLDDGSNRTVDIHRLIAGTFLGPCPSGKEVAHDDGNEHNNRASNLIYKTRDANHADKKRHGTDTAGERHPGAKLTWLKVRAIRMRVAAGAVQRRIAEEYGVAYPTVCNIIKGKIWREGAEQETR
jgi:hypothetical protein